MTRWKNVVISYTEGSKRVHKEVTAPEFSIAEADEMLKKVWAGTAKEKEAKEELIKKSKW